MAVTIRGYEARDFLTLYHLDQLCFSPGIAYSKMMLRYFLNLPSADCLMAEIDGKVAGFLLAEENAPLAHIITLDVGAAYRKKGVVSALVAEMERHLIYRKVKTVLLETSVENEAGIAFWQRHGY